MDNEDDDYKIAVFRHRYVKDRFDESGTCVDHNNAVHILCSVSAKRGHR